MSIPLNNIIRINPGVLSVGNNPNNLFGLLLTQESVIPANQMTIFQNADQIGNLFGYDSIEYDLATVYFAGFTDSDRVAEQLYMAPYSNENVSACLFGASLAAVTLDELKAFTGDLQITIDGDVKSISNPAFKDCKSFSDAAEILEKSLGTSATFSSGRQAFIITSSTTGNTSSVSFATGSLADLLRLSQGQGAKQSPAITDPSLTKLLNSLRKDNRIFCSVFLTWEGTEQEKMELAKWAHSTNDDVCVILSDSHDNATVANTGSSFAEQIFAAKYEGVVCVYNNLELCAFIAGYPAAWDITKTNGRFTAAYRRGSLLQANVNNQDTALALKANGYNFYGVWASGTSDFTFLFEGRISGQFLWLDSWYCQVWIRRHLQYAFIQTLLSKGQIPYNDEGKGILTTAIKPAIDDFINFGAIRKGIALSVDQVQALKQKGLNQSQLNTMSSVGYYLQVDMAKTPPQTRVKRQSPPIDFWYTDGQSVQQINMNSIEIQ